MYHITIRPPGGVDTIKTRMVAFMQEMKPTRLAICYENDDGPTTAHLHCFLDSPKTNGDRTDNLMRPFKKEMARLGYNEDECKSEKGTYVPVVIKHIKPADFCHRVGYIHKDGRILRPEPTFTKPFLQACCELWKATTTKDTTTLKRKRRPPSNYNFSWAMKQYPGKYVSDKLYAAFQEHAALPFLKKEAQQTLFGLSRGGEDPSAVPLEWFERHAKVHFGEVKPAPPPPPLSPRMLPPFNKLGGQVGVMVTFSLYNGRDVKSSSKNNGRFLKSGPLHASWDDFVWWGPKCQGPHVGSILFPTK